MVEEIAVTFFNLLENILRLEGLASTAMVFTHAYLHKYIATQRFFLSVVLKLLTLDPQEEEVQILRFENLRYRNKRHFIPAFLAESHSC